MVSLLTLNYKENQMYKLTKDNTAVIRKADGAFIPMADGNRDYQEYQKWLIEGGVPEAAQTTEEIAAYLRDLKKEARTKKVSEIVVDVGGLLFDGDETSQNRMARTVVAMQTAGVTSIPWTLADNTIVEATVDNLIEALLKSGQAQSAMWAI